MSGDLIESQSVSMFDSFIRFYSFFRHRIYARHTFDKA